MLVSKQAYRRGTNPRWQGVPTVRDSFWVFCLRAPAFRHKFPSRAAWWMKRGGHRRSARGTAGGRGRRSRGGLFRPGRQLPLNLPAAGNTPFAPSGWASISTRDTGSGLTPLHSAHHHPEPPAGVFGTGRCHVLASGIDLQQPSDHRELANAEIQAIPYPRRRTIATLCR